MASRSNDEGKDKAIGQKSYGAPFGAQAPINAGRPSAAPAPTAAVKAAMAADKGTTRAAQPSAPTRYAPASQPLAAPGQSPTGIGGAARERTVDKLVKNAGG